jgi:molybdenum cofactor cytidylyltransferase
MYCVILAAGEGRRLGGPKALLAWPLMPQRWLVPLAVAHVEAHEGRVLVVVREPVARALRHHAPLSFSAAKRLVISEAPDALGPAGSLAAAVASLSDADLSPGERVLVTPVDTPPASVRVVSALFDAMARPGVRAARPVYDGRGGHPVVVEASLLRRYRQPDPPPLRDLLRALGPGRVDVEVDDPQVVLDIDTPADLARWARDHGAGAVEDPAFFSS